jgi:hypothetical protein
MQTSTLTAAARRVQELAQEYQDRGYQVTVGPEPGQLPEPLARFRPDLVARKSDDAVVVEVKPRGSLSDPELQKLAKIVREQPGWRFELVSSEAGTGSARNYGLERGGCCGEPPAGRCDFGPRLPVGRSAPGVVCRRGDAASAGREGASRSRARGRSLPSKAARHEGRDHTRTVPAPLGSAGAAQRRRARPQTAASGSHRNRSSLPADR